MRPHAIWLLGVGSAALLDATPAFAQLRWDVGAQIGVSQHVLTGGAQGTSVPDPGPAAETFVDVAILPLVRAGPYLRYEALLSPTVRHTGEGGLQLKVSTPIFPRPWRGWAFAGLGVAGSVEPAHGGAVGEVPTASGVALVAPIGLAVGTRARDGWEVFAELSARVGLWFDGGLYDHPPCGCAETPYAGRDSLAGSLSVGLSLDE